MKRLLARNLISFMLLGTAASGAVAGPETLLTCADDPVPVLRWSPAGSDTVACHQMVAGAGIDNALIGGDSQKMAAFRKNVLVAIHPGHDAKPSIHDATAYQPGDWLETGRTEIPGELWWGRTATRHIFVGQESIARLGKETASLPASQRAALSDFMMRRMMAMVQKKPMTFKPGDERFRLFPRERVRYIQHAATTMTFNGGHGGDDQVVPAKITNARLDLQAYPFPSGTLTFSVPVDGQTRHITIPLRSPSENEHLRATMSTNATAPVCRDLWSDSDFPAPNDCYIQKAKQGDELYDAVGSFFGDRASLIALHVRLRVNSPPRNRTGTTAMAVIVLKAQ